MENESEPHDAHVVMAHKTFRDVGFTLAAMQFPRPAEAMDALLKFNRAPVGWKPPIAWGYFPNVFCRDNWRAMYAASDC